MRGAKQKKMFEISDLRREILNLRSVCLSVPPPPTPGGGGTLIFSCIPRLRLFWGFKILNFNTFGGLQKTEYFFFLGGGG